MGIEVQDVCTLLQVFDMPRAVRFYRDVLGFEIVGHHRAKEIDSIGACCA